MAQIDIAIPHRGGFLKKLWALTWPYYWSEERWIARGLLAVIIALSLAIVGINVAITYWYNDFYNALQDKNISAFWYQLGKFCVLATAFIVVAVYSNYLQQMLQIRWRRWMTRELLERWLTDQSYYRMQFSADRTDNPEQRIEQDINLFTDAALTHTLGLLNSIVTLVSFITILWTISGPLTVPLFGAEITIPGYMVWVALIYAIVGSVLTFYVGRPLIRTNFMLQRYNATFRFEMARLRENAESVAFYRGEEAERQRLLLSFGDIWTIWWQLMRQQKRLSWLLSGYGQIAIVFPILVAAPRYFSGAIQLGGLMQIRSTFGQVEGALSWFVNAFNSLAEWKATIDRLTGFFDALNQVRQIESGIVVSASSPNELAAEDLALQLPDGRTLLAGLNAKVARGDKVLVTGPSGSGKTTLFRALAGLWPFGKGQVRQPAQARALFLPQRPYLPVGSLRHAIAYPAPAEEFDDQVLRTALDAVNLPHLQNRLDDDQNWAMALSVGEQQRLAIARALLLKPDWLYLDEATAALDAENERQMYELLRTHLPNATILSIAHREAVAQYHDRRLTIDPEKQTARLVPVAAE
ncbi:ABC transporter ATP-binding protein/permease [Dongia sp.]|uniref:ABC transporter ATP-binding protein/permease n=1 Tax=Dongia sp. TaxID=1977262 RepID=UPI0037510DC5